MGIRYLAATTTIKILKKLINLFGKYRASQFSANLIGHLSPIFPIKTKYGSIKFYCLGMTPFYRAENLLTKEPDTIEWIDSFNNNSVFWDIGANVGVYSLYAALRQNIQVLAFEPAASNYYILNKNIEINNMDNNISSFCIAFNDITLIERLYMTNTEPGGAFCSFGEAVDWHGNLLKSIFNQGMLGFTIDDFIDKFDPPFPNYIKIDVDGIEGKIINGAKRTILNERLQSIIIELDTSREDYCNKVINTLKEAGMTLYSRRDASTFRNLRVTSTFNHIFVRS